MGESSKSKSDEYDPITYNHYREFKLQCLEGTGDAFQKLFEKIMVRARPGAFECVRPYGRFGDRKCDGLIESEGIVFQVYSPDELKQAEVQKKIDEDLAGAAQHWSGILKKWVFVYNARRGTPPDIKLTLQQKQKQYPDIEIDSWSNDYLWEIARELNLQQRSEILGASPQWNVEKPKNNAYIPNLPSHLLERFTDLDALKNLVLSRSSQSVGITGTALKVGVHGMGGIGKSVLALMLARDQEVRAAFPDGVFWITVGQEPFLTLRQLDFARMLGDASLTFQDVQQGKVHLSQLLEGKTCLLILDDVWNVEHLAAFNVLGEQSRLLFTTRDSSIAKAFDAFEHQVDLLSDDDALELLAACSGQYKETLPIEAYEIMNECGKLPLALSMIGAIAKARPNRWDNLLHKLQNADLDKIRYQFPDYPYPDLLKTIQVSVDTLEPAVKVRYLDFAVFPEDITIPEATLRTFWEPEGLNEYETQDVIDVLIERSLAQRDENGNLSLHDLQYDYVKKQSSDLPALHNKLLAAYAIYCPQGWHTYTRNGGYFFEHLSYHLLKAGRVEELEKLLTTYNWLHIKLNQAGISSIISDYDLLPEQQNLQPIQRALRLSAHILARDYNQLSGQLLGRLFSQADERIQSLLNETRHNTSSCWLRPLSASLITPDQSLSRSIEVSPGQVTHVIMPPDASYILVATYFMTLISDSKFWQRRRSGARLDVFDVMSGEKFITLLQEDGQIIDALSVAENSSFVVAIVSNRLSGMERSDDTPNQSFVKVWDVVSGMELTSWSFIGTVTAIALIQNDNYIAIAMEDYTIKILDLGTGSSLLNLVGHTSSVNVIKMTNNEKFVVSASGSWADSDCCIKIWELSTGLEVRTLEGHTKKITELAITPNDCVAISTCTKPDIKIWDLATGKTLRTLSVYGWQINTLLTIDNVFAVSASGDNLIVLNIETGAILRKIFNLGYIREVKALQHTLRVVATSANNSLKIWDINLNVNVDVQSSYKLGHDQEITALAVSSDKGNQRIMSGSYDCTLKVWDIEDNEVTLRTTLTAHKSWITSVAITPDGNRAVSGSGWHHPNSDNTVRIWDLKSGIELYNIQGIEKPASNILLTSDSKYLIFVVDRLLKVWDFDRGVEVYSFTYAKPISRVCLSPGNQLLIAGSYGGSLRVWDLESGMEIHSLEGNFWEFNYAVKITPNLKYIVASSNNIIQVWDVENKKEIHTLRGHASLITGILLDDNGNFAISSSTHRTLKIWDLRIGKQIRTLRGHKSPPNILRITLERYVISYSASEIIVWRLDDGQPLATFCGEGSLRFCQATPCGKTIVVADEAGRFHCIRLEI